MRIPSSQQIKVNRYHSDQNREEILDNDALSLDLSLGGMRIVTNASLDVDETVSFFFGEENEPQGFKGIGNVKWIQSSGYEDSIQVGLSFTDQDTCNTVRNYIIGLGL
jgi:Tfp pilus assembly protein PilZ